jgi:SAM-dependent methyltransferase
MPENLFKVVGPVMDPFFARPGVRWKLRRLLDRNAHRLYVGGQAGGALGFREACKFQLDLMVKQGLERTSVFLDLGCGCLRAGLHFIDYLDAGNYLGVDISAEAVYRGITRELGMEAFEAKRPEFVITDSFEVRPLSKRPQFVLANSLFTHLPLDDVKTCLRSLKDFVKPEPTRFFATFSEGIDEPDHTGEGHYLGGRSKMTYTCDEMHDIGQETGWRTEYIGEWGHPKNALGGRFKHQMMFLFMAR